MPPTLLPSQLATLEPLTAEELAAGSLRLDISLPAGGARRRQSSPALQLSRGPRGLAPPEPAPAEPPRSSPTPKFCFKGEP